MNVEQIMVAKQSQPFRAFRVVMSDGRSYLVKHPDFIARSPLNDTVIVFHDDGTWSALDVYQMNEIKIEPPPPVASAKAP